MVWSVSDTESTTCGFALIFRDQDVGGSNPLAPTIPCGGFQTPCGTLRVTPFQRAVLMAEGNSARLSLRVGLPPRRLGLFFVRLFGKGRFSQQ